MWKIVHKLKKSVENWYITFQLWLGKYEQEKTYNRVPVPITKNAVAISYEEGLKKIKEKVLQTGITKEEIESFLEVNKDKLLEFAVNEESHKDLELLKKALIFDKQDVKSKRDLENMIERRIQHYRELQQHKLQRQKLRELRKKNGRPRKD